MVDVADCTIKADAKLAGRRIPIHAGDPPQVFELEAQLLMAYSERIGRDVDDIAAMCGGRRDELEAAQAAYVEKIGFNIPDTTIRAAVKRLAIGKFRLHALKMGMI